MGSFIRVCRLCKEPMESSPFMLCSTCLIESDKVRNYIKKNPLVSIEEISRFTNVSMEKIERMVEPRLNEKNKKGIDIG